MYNTTIGNTVMSNQSYTKGCRDCGQQIRMAEVNGKWAAYELNGNGFHTCKQQQQQKTAGPARRS